MYPLRGPGRRRVQYEVDTARTCWCMGSLIIPVCRFGRLDMLYLNAGIMPTAGLDWGKVLHPSFLATIASGGNVRIWHHIIRGHVTCTQAMKQADYVTEDGLQGVFATNVFGHFVLVRGMHVMVLGLIFAIAAGGRGADEDDATPG